MIVGLDFGTTNTGAATYDGKAVQLLPLDPFNLNSAICRTAIYITRGREYHLGSQAVDLYFHQNIGRSSRYRKVWVGEILQIFAELPPFYRDVYVFEDEFSPGRLFLSIKTALRNPNYLGTVFQDQWFSASDLAAVFLMGMKMHIDRATGQPVREVVLGRPVHFSAKPDEDQIAQSRLVDAAFKAGFEKVYFELEPVAAALSYERTLSKPEIVLVFDFGGGTLDFTIMQVGNAQQRSVLATGGIPVAGDVFDQRLFRVTIPRHLGEGDYFVQNNRRYPIPAHIFDLLTNPQEILSLNTPQNLEMLRSIHLGAQHKTKTDALLKIVSSNYALLLFDTIERLKCLLSEKLGGDLSVKTNDFSIEEYVTRVRFERAILQEYESIRSELLATLQRSGLQPKDIDRVIRTGGSSQIPLFVNMLHELFGEEKVRAIDVFSSVTSGLGIRALEIERGMVEVKAWEPSQIEHTETISGRNGEKSEATPVDLNIVRQRLEVLENYEEGRTELPEALALVIGSGRLDIFQPSENQCDSQFSTWAQQGFIAPTNQHALLITDSFKLLTRDLASIYLARQASQTGIRELFHLEADEAIVTGNAWNAQEPEKRFIVLVTNTGQVRSFDARLMAEHILPRPYFQLDKRYTGLPAVIMLAEENELIVLGTNNGRVGWCNARQVQVMAAEALRAKGNERVTTASVCADSSKLLAVNLQGLALPFNIKEIPNEGPPANRGMILRRGFEIVAIYPFEFIKQGEASALTSLGRQVNLYLPENPLQPLPMRVVRLEESERILYM